MYARTQRVHTQRVEVAATRVGAGFTRLYDRHPPTRRPPPNTHTHTESYNIHKTHTESHTESYKIHKQVAVAFHASGLATSFIHKTHTESHTESYSIQMQVAVAFHASGLATSFGLAYAGITYGVGGVQPVLDLLPAAVSAHIPEGAGTVAVAFLLAECTAPPRSFMYNILCINAPPRPGALTLTTLLPGPHRLCPDREICACLYVRQGRADDGGAIVTYIDVHITRYCILYYIYVHMCMYICNVYICMHACM